MIAFLLECVVSCILFTIPLLIIGRNPISGIHNYPPTIIQRVKELGMIQDTQMPRSKAVIAKKAICALIVALLCAVAARYINGATTFWDGAGVVYLLWTVVNWYDALVIDIFWFCHSKRFILPGTEDLTDNYHDYLFHIKGSLIGQLYGLPAALLAGGLTALLEVIL